MVVHLSTTLNNVTTLPRAMQNSFTWSKLCCFSEKVDGFENSRLLCL